MVTPGSRLDGDHVGRDGVRLAVDHELHCPGDRFRSDVHGERHLLTGFSPTPDQRSSRRSWFPFQDPSDRPQRRWWPAVPHRSSVRYRDRLAPSSGWTPRWRQQAGGSPGTGQEGLVVPEVRAAPTVRTTGSIHHIAATEMPSAAFTPLARQDLLIPKPAAMRLSYWPGSRPRATRTTLSRNSLGYCVAAGTISFHQWAFRHHTSNVTYPRSSPSPGPFNVDTRSRF